MSAFRRRKLAASARLIAIVALAAAAARADEIQASKQAAEAIAPRETIRLFNGKDLSGFYPWLKKTGREDPSGVFRVVDGMIRASDDDLGYLATERSYKDYRLTLEYKWGRRNPRDKYVRNSGVLLHGTGPDGSAGGVWMTSIECQLAQGCEGDLIVIPGKTAEGKPFPAIITSHTVTAADGRTRWDPSGKPTVYSGKQFWWSKHQVGFKELIDTRGRDDVASPLGEWTRVECICAGKRITIKVNGQIVNACFDAHPAEGEILLQTEGHEVYFRNVELHPLDSDKP